MALGWRQVAAGVRRALSPPVEAPADLAGWRARVLCSVRLCAASDATRQEYLGHSIARGIALYDMLEDSIADEVAVLEGQPERRAGTDRMCILDGPPGRNAMIRLLITCFAAAVLAASPASAQNQGSKPRLAAEFSSDWFYDGVPEKLASLTGKEAPALSVDEWHGEARPGDLRGKVVVIDFWGTWCPPCVAAIPKNVELVEKYQREGLVFIGVHDARRGWDRVRQMAGQHRINYPVARDAEGGVSAQKFGLGFWPTYIAIDRQGIVRAAGLKPSRVEDVVKVLLAEPGPGGAAGAAGGAPLEPRYLISSSRRPAALREIEGKPLPPLEGEAWLGEAGAAPSPEQMAGRVVAVLFLSARDRISLHQAGRLAELERELGADFVAVGVAPADDLWDRLEALAADGKLPGRVMRDRPVEVNGARPLGVFGEACGVRQTPMMLLVDRRGIVRGAGVRPDRLVEAAKLLLAEPKPEPEGEAESAGGMAGGGG